MAYLEMTHWTWLIAGLIMLVIELLAPFAFFLWLGASAFVTAAIVLLIPDISWQFQALLFSVLAVASVYLSKRYLKKKMRQSETPHLNQRANQYIGRVVLLCDPITNGMGRATVDDSQWQVSGPTLSAGTAVRIIGVDGAVFQVEAAD